MKTVVQIGSTLHARLGAILVAVALLAACTTPVERTPDWVDGIPVPGGPGTSFVAYGRAPTPGVAADRAVADAESQVAQILLSAVEAEGVLVTADAGVAVETAAARRIEDLEPVDSYRRTDASGAVERYLLYRYLPSQLEQDVRQVIAGLPESVPPPADTPSPTAQRPLETVRAILEGPVPEGEREREQRLLEALAGASELVVRVQPGELTIDLGDEVDREFSVAVSERARPDPYTEVAVAVTVRGPEVDGLRDERRFPVITDGDGRARFRIEAPTVSGTTRVTVEPAWLNDAVSRWEAAISDQDRRDLLSATAERLRDRAVIDVRSRAAEIPTAILVLDRDIAGNPIESRDTMRGMLQEFATTAFRVRQVDPPAAGRDALIDIDALAVADLYDLLPFEVLSRVDRVIVGSAQIQEFTEGDGFFVQVSARAAAFDLRRDLVLARVVITERISGTDARAAIRAAFQAAGRRLVRRIAPRLP